MEIELRNLKGTADFMPQDQRLRQEIIRKLQNVFEKYGFQPIETPIVCYFEVLASKYAGGSEILKEVYKLTDQGGRELGLRYDLTVPFARVIGMNYAIRMPFKRYEIGKVFRDGPIKSGRTREFIQCDVDMVGVRSVMAEAELMAMAVEVYNMLGLEVYISYNNRKLLSGIIESVGILAELAPEVILIIDKLEKIGAEGVRSELSQLGINGSNIDLLINLMKMEIDELLQTFISKQNNELIRKGIEELDELNSYIGILGIEKTVHFTPSLARGLEIYTGTVWEVFLTDGSIKSSVGAGGRYDNIIGLFLDNGIDYPAVGMTFGLDVIYEALIIKGFIADRPTVEVYIIPLGTEKSCIKLVMDLRNEGIKADIEMSGKKLKKSLDYANKLEIPYVIIIGENELQSGVIKLKDMQKSCDLEVSIDLLIANIKGLLRGKTL